MKKVLRLIPLYPMFVFFKITALNGGISLKKTPLFIGYLLRYLMSEPLRYLELLMYTSKIRKHVLTVDPIFVLGHWRSGTSHLQSLIRLDPNTTSISIYSSIFGDHFMITESWLKPILAFMCRIFKIQYAIQRIPMNLDAPGELDTALCSAYSEHSYTWGHIFPKTLKKWLSTHILFTEGSFEKDWMEEYDFFIRKLSYASKGKRVVVKSPGDTGRVKALLKKYPNAMFVYIHRDPLGVFVSNQYLWEVIQGQYSLQTLTAKAIEEHILLSYQTLLKAYLAQKDGVPRDQLIEIDFKDLQRDPVGEIRKIYTQMNRAFTFEESVTAYISKNPPQKVNLPVLDPSLKERVLSAWAFS
jgi:hypothetical protein